MIIIGAGNLGQAIANYTNFERRGFVIRGMFDINPKLIGLVIRGIEIRSVDDLETFIRENNIQIAALTIPKTKAPEIADRLIKAGIKAIWNFAHTDLVVPDDVVVENVHLSESLMRLSYRVCNMQEKSDAEDKKKNKKRVNVMILGVGTDLVEIDRMRKACEKNILCHAHLQRRKAEQEGLPLSFQALCCKRGGSQGVWHRFSHLYAGRY